VSATLEASYICYQPRDFRPAALATIGQANKIILEYAEDGYALTLRQLYYQMVARGLIPNQQREYERLGSIVSDGRMAGLISWTAIEDRGRNLMGLQSRGSPAEAFAAARASYRRDLWEDQPCRVEAWVEKQALEGVLGSICDDLRVDYFSTKGYNSQSEQWRAGLRLARYVQQGQRPIILHLADHDPAGLDMTRDNRERLERFAGVPILVVRLALNMEQVEEVGPPPNPVKEGDSKTPAYVARYGDECWELDALDPHYIHNLIRKAVDRFRDEAKWSAALKREAEDLNEMDALIEEMGGGDEA
jgi:Arc/MetJ-type ribon-helix-helix transcriptional regulator